MSFVKYLLMVKYPQLPPDMLVQKLTKALILLPNTSDTTKVFYHFSRYLFCQIIIIIIIVILFNLLLLGTYNKFSLLQC